MLTVFLFKSRFFAKFLWFDDPSGRSAAGRMAPMAQFQLPAVRVVNPTELSARFCGERSRFSLWVRAANMSWRGSDRPMKCEHVSPRVYAALTVRVETWSVRGVPSGPCTRKCFQMLAFFNPTGALLAFGHFELPFSRYKTYCSLIP